MAGVRSRVESHKIIIEKSLIQNDCDSLSELSASAKTF